MAKAILESMSDEINDYWKDQTTVLIPLSNDSNPKIIEQNKVSKDMPSKNNPSIKIDSRKVFVVHGRNWEARNALFAFLRSIGLQPLEWSEAIHETGKTSPYVGEVLDVAFSIAQAVIVLFTPDDEARLLQPFRNSDDESHETQLTPQARPNVLFEAGMAMGRNPDRTILIELGKLRPFSDIGGRHVVRLNNSTQKRQDLAQRLLTANCAVNLVGTDWHTEGDFEKPVLNLKIETDNGELVVKNDTNLSASNSDYKLNPIFEIQGVYASPNSLDEEYKLIIKVKNEGRKVIRDYRIDVLFPNDFLNPHVMYGLEMPERQTATHKLFRWLPVHKNNQPIYPEDIFTTISLTYLLNEKLRQNDEAMNQNVKVSIFAEDNFELVIENKMSKIVESNNFS
jgi:predicted nucleotide-binding protein